MPRATLADVAAAAGVSKATASKVLNRRGGSSPATRARVEAAMLELGYTPITRDRAPHESGAVAVVFDTLLSMYSLRVLEGLADGAQRAGVELVVSVAETGGAGFALDAAAVQRAADRGHAGLVIVTTAIDPEIAAACHAHDLPLVAVDAPSAVDGSIVAIGSDHWRGGQQATTHLLDLGHRRIAFVGGDPDIPGLRERLAGYREAHALAGVPVDEALVSEEGMTSGDAALERMLRLDDPPTAVFGTTDADALLAIRTLVRSGLRVPEDVSVVGYDDTYASVPSSPALTSVHAPMHAIGALAVSTVLDLRRGIRPVSHRVQLATDLVVRESSAPPPA